MRLALILLTLPLLSCGSYSKPTVDIKATICKAATAKGVECAIMYSICKTESECLDVDSDVDHDSTGIFQIRTGTASWLTKRDVKLKDIKGDIKLSSELAVLRYLDCKRAMSIGAEQIRVREIICFNRGPSGTWAAVRRWGDLRVLRYWKRYVSHWVKYKHTEER